MKNIRPWIVVLISVLAGAAAVIAAARWMAQQTSIATQKVVVATRDLELGTRLRPDMLQVIEWPASTQLKEPYTEPDKVVGRVINAQILRGEPVLAARLAPPGEKGGLSAVLDEGKRAITVKVNEIVGVAGFALPGNYVDLMVNTPDDSNRPISKIVLERILVLAVAQDTSVGETKPRVVSAVTLEVTPQQAEQIDVARSIGSLSLVLRSQADKGNSVTVGARKSDLLQAMPSVQRAPENGVAEVRTQGPAPAVTVKPAPARKVAAARAPAPAAADRSDRVEVIRGLKRTTEHPQDEPAPASGATN